jgi:SEC-C motif domain protein
MDCPCGSQTDFDRCCGPYLTGTPAPTAEALMRSRYTAYVKANVDHIIATHDPDLRKEVDREATERWARESTWKGLTVVKTEAGGPSDDEGTVEFIARYRLGNEERSHHEVSRFRKVEGRWYFVDGRPPKGVTVRAQPTPERNAPCPCGSGKKYKKCHGLTAG